MNDLYKDVDDGMSNSNIGGRKRRQANDHLFVLYGIINHVNKESKEEALQEVSRRKSLYRKFHEEIQGQSVRACRWGKCSFVALRPQASYWW